MYEDPSGHYATLVEEAAATSISNAIQKVYFDTLFSVLNNVATALYSVLVGGGEADPADVLQNIGAENMSSAFFGIVGIISTVSKLSPVLYLIMGAAFSVMAIINVVKAVRYCYKNEPVAAIMSFALAVINIVMAAYCFHSFYLTIKGPTGTATLEGNNGDYKVTKGSKQPATAGNGGGSESVLPPNTKPDFIVTPEGTVMDTSKNYNLVGSGEQGDWFQIHNYGKPEDGFGFPHTHKPQLNTNGTNTSYKRVVSNTTAADIDNADELLRTGKMTFRKKGRR